MIKPESIVGVQTDAIAERVGRPPRRRAALVMTAASVCLGGLLLASPAVGLLICGAVFVDLILEIAVSVGNDNSLAEGPGPATNAVVTALLWSAPVCLATSVALIAVGARRVRSYLSAVAIGAGSALVGLLGGASVLDLSLP